MTNQQRFATGVALGAGAMLAAYRLARSRHAISFDGRVVVITGGSRGLGLVMARLFAAEGAKVAVLARDVNELERARQDLEPRGGEVVTIRCDIRRRADVRAAIDQVMDRWHAVDVLVNNAGVIQVGPFDHMDHDDFENAMATHFWGPLHLMLEVVPIMQHRTFGRIVNIASIGGKIAVPHLTPYSASKFALVGLSDGARAELERYGIRVTTVAPGLMRTGSPRNATFKGRHESEYAWFKISSSIPGVTISAERAARKILEAARHGDPELTITPQAKAAAAVNVVLPGLVARAMMLVDRLLPGPSGAGGDRVQRGRESESRWAPRIVTALTDKAAVANNEL
ncbi:MAG TPA: SDR family oxidoreductase [Vicinamibacterales bacterium]|jgi:NAD(P)-dependent dehydrogenase (short-subunit alcohol dehydrogenase family)|nr:SDR family oxidoreductase [Vicinamibacterales bacterium]